MEPYYYGQMNKTQQAIYREMKAGITALAASFPVPLAEGTELSEIF